MSNPAKARPRNNNNNRNNNRNKIRLSTGETTGITITTEFTITPGSHCCATMTLGHAG
jgi:hypothetical protein